jgi:vesicle coat complex subunit
LELAVYATKVLGSLSQKEPLVAPDALKALMALIKSGEGTTWANQDVLVGQAIVVIRSLVTLSPGSSKSLNSLVRYFMTNHSQINVPLAKASILWLVCHHITSLENLAPDTLRISLKSFCEEASIVKIFTLNLSLILLTHHRKTQSTLVSFSEPCFEYATKLAKFDLDLDVRDFGRMVSHVAASKDFDALHKSFKGFAPKATAAQRLDGI